MDSRDVTTYVRKDARVYPKSALLRWGISLKLSDADMHSSKPAMQNALCQVIESEISLGFTLVQWALAFRRCAGCKPL